MLNITARIWFKSISIILIATFLSIDMAWAAPDFARDPSNLAAPSNFQRADDVGKSFKSEFAATGVILSIARYLLGDPAQNLTPMPYEHMAFALSKRLGENADSVDLSKVVLRPDGTVLIPFTEDGKLFLAEASLKIPSVDEPALRSKDLSDRYSVIITVVPLDMASADPVVRKTPAYPVSKTSLSILLAAAATLFAGCGSPTDKEIAQATDDARTDRPESVRRAAISTLIDGLKDDNEYIATKAANALGEVGAGHINAVSALIETLKDERKYRQYVFLSSLRALGKIGPSAKEAIPVLKDLMINKASQITVNFRYAAKPLRLLVDLAPKVWMS
jgi:hypothetical protein